LSWQKSKQKERAAFVRDFAGLAEFCREMGAEDVVASLARLPLPGGTGNDGDWQTLADGLWRILEEERGFLPPRPLSAEEYVRMNNYFYAVELLVRCLELAYVTDRQGVLDGLLRPPWQLTGHSALGGAPPPLPAVAWVRLWRGSCWERRGTGHDWCVRHRRVIAHQYPNCHRQTPLSRPD